MGFEDLSSISTLMPNSFNYWSGDITDIEGVDNGITPFEGSRMMQFVVTHSSTTPKDQDSSDIAQLIDMSPYQSLVSSGNAVINMSAWFNRVQFETQTDTQFAIAIRAWDGLPSDYPAKVIQGGMKLAGSAEIIDTDGLLTTWEQAQTCLTLPINTEYISISVVAKENILNDLSGVEFDGHYVDAVSVSIVPEPMSCVLLGIGSLGLIRRRLRK